MKAIKGIVLLHILFFVYVNSNEFYYFDGLIPLKTMKIADLSSPPGTLVGIPGVSGNWNSPGMDYDPIHDKLFFIPGSNGPSNLYTLDRITGVATLIGPHGIPNLEGLAYDTKNQVLYASAYSGSSSNPSLFTLNVQTGGATAVAPLFITVAANKAGVLCGGLAYDIKRDRLVGLGYGGKVVEIDRATGSCTTLYTIPFGSWAFPSLSYDYSLDSFTAVAGIVVTIPADFSNVNTRALNAAGGAFINSLCDDSPATPVLSGCQTGTVRLLGSPCVVDNYNVPTAADADGCGSPTVTKQSGPGSGSCMNDGDVVIYEAVDNAGNTATCTWTYSVAPVNPPTVSNLALSTGSTSVQVNKIFKLLVTFSDSDGDTVDIYVDFDQDGTSDSNVISAVGGREYQISWKYTIPERNYCVRVCLDDHTTPESCTSPGAFDQFSCLSTTRAIGGGALLVNVLLSGGGDPYFVGFDGVVFRFDGKPGHVYNLLSSPFLQFNGLIDVGRDAEGAHHMHSVVRAVACLWEDNALYFSVSNRGQLNATIYRGDQQEEVLGFSADSGNWTATVGRVRLTWQPNNNETRQMAQMSNHQEIHRLTLDHPLYHLELMQALFVPQNQPQALSYFFVDMAMSFASTANGCYEGVWGRTSCVSSSIAPVEEQYDLDGNIFAVQSPKSLFAAQP